METLEQMKERQRQQQQQRRAVYGKQSKAIVNAYQRVRKSK